MQIRDVIDFNRLPIETIAVLGNFEKKFKIVNVEFLVVQSGTAGDYTEFGVYDAKKMYIAFELACNAAVLFKDEANNDFQAYYQNNGVFDGGGVANPTATNLIKNIVFSNFTIVTNVVSFIGLKITLV